MLGHIKGAFSGRAHFSAPNVARKPEVGTAATKSVDRKAARARKKQARKRKGKGK